MDDALTDGQLELLVKLPMELLLARMAGPGDEGTSPHHAALVGDLFYVRGAHDKALELWALTARVVPELRTDERRQATRAVGRYWREAGLPGERVTLYVAAATLGAFDAAEDALFDLADRFPDDARRLGESFYDQLTDLSDEQLEEGGLDRSELAEGRADLMAQLSGSG